MNDRGDPEPTKLMIPGRLHVQVTLNIWGGARRCGLSQEWLSAIAKGELIYSPLLANAWVRKVEIVLHQEPPK